MSQPKRTLADFQDRVAVVNQQEQRVAAVSDFLTWLTEQRIKPVSFGDPWAGEPLMTVHTGGELIARWIEENR
jgi:hypothetical protein